jgi:hypothetical protein
MSGMYSEYFPAWQVWRPATAEPGTPGPEYLVPARTSEIEVSDAPRV